MMYSALFHRNPRTPDAWSEAIGMMANAAPRLEGQLGTFHTGRVGIIVRPDSGQSTDSARAQLDAILRTEPSTAALTLSIEDDHLGAQWVIARGTSLKGLVRDTGLAGEALLGRDISARIVAAVFPFTWNDTRQYWIYQRRIKKYTPFVPVGAPAEERRDPALEARMEKALRRELPTEKKMSEWYPIWGMPI
jgi:hypothetical protein